MAVCHCLYFCTFQFFFSFVLIFSLCYFRLLCSSSSFSVLYFLISLCVSIILLFSFIISKYFSCFIFTLLSQISLVFAIFHVLFFLYLFYFCFFLLSVTFFFISVSCLSSSLPYSVSSTRTQRRHSAVRIPGRSDVSVTAQCNRRAVYLG